MHRQLLLNNIERYIPLESEGNVKENFINFIKSNKNCFDRSCLLGHITASSFVVSPDKKALLLCLHAKWNKWVQLGGHADGECDILAVALKETFEESGIGIENLEVKKEILDLSIYEVSSRLNDPAHYHFDVSYLMFSKIWDVTCSSESKDLRWIKFEDIKNLSDEPSLQRALLKIQHQLA